MYVVLAGMCGAATPAPTKELDCSMKQLAFEFSQGLLSDPFHVQRNATKHVYTALDLAGCPNLPWTATRSASPPAEPVSAGGATFYVSTTGSDNNPGTQASPFATLPRAQTAARGGGPGTVVNLAAGRYELNETFVLTAADSGTTYAGAETGGGTVLSGGRRLTGLSWRPSSTGRAGVFQAALPDGLDFTSLLAGGVRQTAARFPNGNAETSLFPEGYQSAGSKWGADQQWKRKLNKTQLAAPSRQSAFSFSHYIFSQGGSAELYALPKWAAKVSVHPSTPTPPREQRVSCSAGAGPGASATVVYTHAPAPACEPVPVPPAAFSIVALSRRSPAPAPNRHHSPPNALPLPRPVSQASSSTTKTATTRTCSTAHCCSTRRAPASGRRKWTRW
jgi:hypothetical protein